MSAALDGNVEHDVGAYAAWTFRAPAGTQLVGFRAQRTSLPGPDRPYGSPAAVFKTETEFLEQCSVYYGCSSLSGPLVRSLDGVPALIFGVECGGAPGSRCSTGGTQIGVQRMSMSVSDERAPLFVTPPSGTLVGANTSRIRSLNYSATDEGGGIYRHRLLVDGAQVASGTVDDNSGKCVRYSVGGGFAHRVPCKLSASGSLSFDTSRVSDGAHEVTLEVYDATDSNKVVHGPWSINVDNVAPAVGEVVVTGTAREGEILRCSATVSGQQARTTYQWVRTASDGSAAADIVGAEAATYTLTAQDIGKKVLCRVSGADAGGSSSSTSGITSGPFANGATVSPKPVVAATDGNGGAGGGTTGGGGTSTAGGSGGSQAADGASGSSASVTTGLAAAVAAAASAVAPCTTARVEMPAAATRLNRSYNRSSVALKGRLVGTAGEPKVGRVLDVMQVVSRAGTTTRTNVGSARTGADGSFRATAPAGPSRAIQLVDPACGSVGPIITQRVRGAVQAKTTTKRIRNRQKARFSGRVLGGFVGRGIPVELQVRVGRQWRDVKHTITNARGAYKLDYRFTRTYIRYTYKFRVVTRAGGGWPYMPGVSRTVKVRVN